jgi:hypothetical protein
VAAPGFSGDVFGVVRMLCGVTRDVQLHFISPSPPVREDVTDPG